MKPAPFHYERPDTMAALLDLLAQSDPDTKILAGGQSLVPMMNFRLARPGRLIDINRLPALDYIRQDGDEIAIGALARHADIKASKLMAEHCPLVVAAYEWVAHHAVRNRGTLAGNLCHCDPASEMPAIMLASEATMVIRSKEKTRTVKAADFFVGMYETAVKSNEILVEIRIPVKQAGRRYGFREVSARKGDFAWVAVCALMTVAQGKVQAVALAVAGVGTKAVRLTQVEQAITGQDATQATFAMAAQLAFDSVKPFGDPANSAQYRSDLVRALTERTLADAAALA
jgi:aerobic carbon-monoxide dehydrogenase medium subunit